MVDLTPGETFLVNFVLPDVIVGTVQDLEVVPSYMSTNSILPDGTITEQGSATLELGGDVAGSGTVNNFDPGVNWLGAFAGPSSLVSPAVLVSNFGSLVAPGIDGSFAFHVLAGDLSFDPSSLIVILGNGDGTYYPENSPTIISAGVVPEPDSLGLVLGGLAGLTLLARRGRR